MGDTGNTKSKLETMEEAINTENDFLKFVNDLPLTSEVNDFLPTHVSHFYKLEEYIGT